MSLTPKVDRENYTKMLLSLKAFKDVGGLVKMTSKQLENMPKEVMITLAPNEIALVWEKLPTDLKTDSDMLKYQFCYEHPVNGSSSDVEEGPVPRRLFCCYCKVSDVSITAENCMKTTEENRSKSANILNLFSCCCCKST